MSPSVDDVDVMLQEIRNEVDSIQDMPDGVEKINLRKVEPELPVISIAIFGDKSEARSEAGGAKAERRSAEAAGGQSCRIKWNP